MAKAAGTGETADALYAFLLERVRTNLHVVLCLSPVGEAFRERCRMFPGLVNCTTIDWFTEWPGDALFEVAQKQLGDVDLGGAEVKTAVCKVGRRASRGGGGGGGTAAVRRRRVPCGGGAEVTACF